MRWDSLGLRFWGKQDLDSLGFARSRFMGFGLK